MERSSMNYIDRLIENCHKAKLDKPIQEFIADDVSKLKGIKKAIYIFTQVGGDIEETYNQLVEFKKKKIKACPALNSPSQTMYVGSSTTGLEKRIKQHLGNGADKTYALHLSSWFKGKYTLLVKEYDCPREIIQLIEDNISDQLKPAFGKKGGNNK